MECSTKLLDRLDRLSPWAFTGVLYLARWGVILAVSYLINLVWPSGSNRSFGAASLTLLFGFLIAAPVLETTTECLVPYWLMRKLGTIPSSKRPWAFIIVASGLM